jgi:hypothetical protein
MNTHYFNFLRKGITVLPRLVKLLGSSDLTLVPQVAGTMGVYHST